MRTCRKVKGDIEEISKLVGEVFVRAGIMPVGAYKRIFGVFNEGFGMPAVTPLRNESAVIGDIYFYGPVSGKELGAGVGPGRCRKQIDPVPIAFGKRYFLALGTNGNWSRGVLEFKAHALLQQAPGQELCRIRIPFSVDVPVGPESVESGCVQLHRQ